jgi:hypothetical protein
MKCFVGVVDFVDFARALVSWSWSCAVDWEPAALAGCCGVVPWTATTANPAASRVVVMRLKMTFSLARKTLSGAGQSGARARSGPVGCPRCGALHRSRTAFPG